VPATADAEGRIRCRVDGTTLLWLKDGFVTWDARIGKGRHRTFAIPADSPALKDLLVRCENCGKRYIPQPLTTGLVEIQHRASVLKPVNSGAAA
jgi:hypothetical protein